MLFVFSNANAQTLYFNKYFGRQIDTDVINNIVKSDTGYHLVSGSNNLYFPYSNSINYYFVNNEGQTIIEKQYYRDSITGGAAIFKKYENKLIVATSMGSNNPEIWNYSELLMFNSDFELINNKRYIAEDSMFEDNPSDFIRLHNGTFIIVGFRLNTITYDWDAYYMFTDSSGNQLSRINFEGVYTEHFTRVIQDTFSKHIYIVGYQKLNNTKERDIWVIKIDTVGNTIWEKKFGGSYNDLGTSIIQSSDGNFVISVVSLSPQQGYLFKIDSSGNQLWQSDFVENDTYYSGTSFYTLAENPDGTLVATGIAGQPGIQHDAGVLVKFSSTGQFLWKQLYDFFPTGSEYLTGVVPTTDGGYLMAGAAMDTTLPSQQAWVLKVDSLGCPVENCSVGIKGKNQKEKYLIYPNPANDVITIVIPSNNGANALLKDFMGKTIYNITLESRHNTINVSQLPKGLYLLEVNSETEIWNKKLIIE